jgi:hypothetical protein
MKQVISKSEVPKHIKDEKAIHHLSYELERLKQYKDTSDLDEIINKNNNKNDNRGNKKGI